jgi:hypothetical protein
MASKSEFLTINRAQYDDGPILNVQIFNINMDSAGFRNTGQGQALFVEECRCPAGYAGLSCEVSCYMQFVYEASLCKQFSFLQLFLLMV